MKNKIKIFDNSEQLYDYLADIIITKINKKPNIPLGLATGSTPIPLYERLINAYKKNKVDFKNVSTINLDEYIGLASTHEQSYRYFMDSVLFNHININKLNTFVPNGAAADLEKECQDYRNVVISKKIDIQILGIGTNGHIAFNEPGSSFESTTRVVPLANKTREDNKRFFNNIEEVPKEAITMGIKDILLADKIIMIAVGKGKAVAIRNMIKGPITEEVPASVLQKHPNVLILADKSAASLI